jgi:signal transduction histidine kinase
VAVAQTGGTVALSVSDEGIGIAPADHERVFDRFFRTEHAAATVGGTGLGLALAREIVRAHGGTIELDSEPGAGATFRVTLPVGVAAGGNGSAPADVEKLRD